MEIVKLTDLPAKKIIKRACEVLAKGGLVIYPTETVYGVGVDATNQQAVDKLLAYKSRREGKPLSIAVTDEKMAGKFVEINDQAHHIYQRFLPGPVTVVSKVKEPSQQQLLLANGVASEFQTVGIRIPDFPLIKELVQAYQKPITATSANASGEKRPYQISDILERLSNKQKNLIDLIIDAGELAKNEPSSVIDTTLSTPVTLRAGAIKFEQQNTEPSNEHLSQFFELKARTKLLSNSEQETSDLAGKLLLKYLDQLKTTGLVIGLNGRLGAGKTIFAKGAAKFLKITDLLRSPTYTYWFDYNFTRFQTSGKLIHADLWKIDDPQILEKIQLMENLQANHVLLIEWFNQLDNQQLAKIAQQQAPLIVVSLTNTNEENSREIIIEEYLAKK